MPYSLVLTTLISLISFSEGKFLSNQTLWDYMFHASSSFTINAQSRENVYNTITRLNLFHSSEDVSDYFAWRGKGSGLRSNTYPGKMRLSLGSFSFSFFCICYFVFLFLILIFWLWNILCFTLHGLKVHQGLIKPINQAINQTLIRLTRVSFKTHAWTVAWLVLYSDVSVTLLVTP